MKTLEGNKQNQVHRASVGIRERFGPESGQSLLEVALLTPMLILLLLGAIDIGRYAYFAIEVANAARAAVAYGSQNGFTAADTAGTNAAACNDFSGQSTCSLTVLPPAYVCECDNSGTMSSISCTTGSCTSTENEVVSLAVTVNGSFNVLFSLPGIPSSITVTRTATMRIGNLT